MPPAGGQLGERNCLDLAGQLKPDTLAGRSGSGRDDGLRNGRTGRRLG